ncbi:MULTISPECIES: histidine kinase [unclassified Gordonia (in: high G+C Gram-positive bacteria)]|uniref:sensor histidine kinase n=1 Tax=unclassified Gordonia (in: high G+C Gram-positive bacteria) TaxID=2657482 RepID=UPI0027DB95A0|nr:MULTISPECIES: histidine kinase [unclassified Gordonia (in: high G+C Gram-positive bacteria)]
MTGFTAEMGAGLRRRIERAGGDYPPLYPAVILSSSVVVTLVSTAQRFSFDQIGWVIAALVLAVLSLVLDLTLPPTSYPCSAVITSTVCFLMVPTPTDAAPLQLVLVAAIAAAMYPLLGGLIVTAACLVVIVWFGAVGGLESPAIYALGVACGWLIGYMMLIQKRLADNRARVLAERADRAASDERQRIAREIHDVIAHSLSITMLNVTGARRVLEQDRDIEEALEALSDAERQGRQAMTEIRTIVHVLGTTEPTGSTAPSPGAGDLVRLVEDYRKAGVDIDFSLVGDLTELPRPVGAALYRITQESLANVVKHSVAKQASVSVSVADAVALTVENPATEDRPRECDGTGIEGMTQRAALLGGTLQTAHRAGTWSVHATLPSRPLTAGVPA